MDAESTPHRVDHVGQTRAWEMAWLIAMGMAAASAMTFWDWSLGIPGHAILRVVFPMTLGLAVVPRRGGGVVMGTAALGTVGAFSLMGFGHPGLGAMSSLTLFGPLADGALWRIRRGWMLWAGFALAGLGANVVAFGVRAIARIAGMGRADGAAPVAASGRGGGMGGGGMGGGGMGGGGGLGGGMGRGTGMGRALTEQATPTAVDTWWFRAPLSYLLCGLLVGLLCAALWFAVRPRESTPVEAPGT